MRNYLPALLLLALACGPADRPPADSLPVDSAQDSTSTPSRRSADRRRAIPQGRTDTTFWVDSTKRSDSTFFSRGRAITSTVVLTDSQWVRPPVPSPGAALGMPNGPFHLPPDSLCKQDELGYNATFRFAHSSGRYIVGDLKTAKRCNGRLIVGISRNRFKSTPDTGLSVKNGLAEIAQLPWAEMRPYIEDGTVLGFYAADDLSSHEWGKASMTVKMARWDSIYGELKRRAPNTPRIVRAKPTELKDWGYKGTNITTAWAQHRGPYRDKHPKTWVAAQVTAAKVMKLGLIIGQNLLDGGCGPVSLGACLENVPGTGIWGTTREAASVRRFQTSAAELTYYKTIMLTEPYACASIDWQWSPIWTANRPAEQLAGIQNFHRREDVQAAMKALGVVAKSRQPASCIHPDRR